MVDSFAHSKALNFNTYLMSCISHEFHTGVLSQCVQVDTTVHSLSPHNAKIVFTSLVLHNSSRWEEEKKNHGYIGLNLSILHTMLQSLITINNTL